MLIGVFDSGIGGKSVAKAIKTAMPDVDILVKEDHDNVPYGSKTPEQLQKLVTPILLEMEQQGCQAIVIACNTVSTTIISQLREAVTVPLVALEPMVKPAATLTKSGVIAVCATPGTLASERYAWLKQTYASDITVLEPDCSNWAYMVENDQIDSDKISETVNAVLSKGADVIVLGCTHYHWIEEQVRAICGPRARVIQPEQAVIKQLWKVIEQLT